jgi:hypothetical protein
MSAKRKQQHKRAQKREAAAQKRRRQRTMPAPNAFAYTVEDAMAMGGPGRTALYQLRMNGTLDWFTDAIGRVMIKGNSLRKLLHADQMEIAE